VSCGKLSPFEHDQLDLFTPVEQVERSHAIDSVVDHLRDRYGKDAIFKAHSLMSGGTYLNRSKYIGGHKG
jgi:DNA polymerase V